MMGDSYFRYIGEDDDGKSGLLRDVWGLEDHRGGGGGGVGMGEREQQGHDQQPQQGHRRRIAVEDSVSDLDADGSDWMGEDGSLGYIPTSDMLMQQQDEEGVSVLNHQLQRIARIINASPTAAAAFSRIKWDTVENRCSPFWRPLVDVLEAALGISFRHFEVAEVVLAYSTHRGKFDHRRFLKDVFKMIQNIDASPIPVQLSQLTVYNTFSMSRPVAREETDAPTGLLEEEGADGSLDALQGVLAKVTEALVIRGPASADADFGFPPVLDKEALRKELKRVWKLILSYNDLSIFFRHLDKEGAGSIRSEFLTEELKRLKKSRSSAAIKSSGPRLSPTKPRAKGGSLMGGRESPDGEAGPSSGSLQGRQSPSIDDASVGMGSLASIGGKSMGSQSLLSSQGLKSGSKPVLSPVRGKAQSMQSLSAGPNTDPFQSLVLKISAVFEHPRQLGVPVHFQLPSDMIPESQVISAFREQLGIQVTSAELQSFQDRIEVKNADGKNRKFKKSSILPSTTASYSGNDLKAFVVRIGIAVQKKDEYRARLLLHGKSAADLSASASDPSGSKETFEADERSNREESIKLPSVVYS